MTMIETSNALTITFGLLAFITAINLTEAGVMWFLYKKTKKIEDKVCN